ncbi:alpha-1,2-fucosyltransferase [Pedobacter frigidisoli]|uniref:Alpha-1,2-fucosyltransferase n=1 Tax=Pedobacter frigidisoli TaxID=2530455 RepID=A0A4R0PAH2_9SPHI|nr:alpha-1,2-fucosyltransferase [Pedobacter frigidisoli]TCD12754.1 alpha-1,2-fucosyltransferase [Pedobacter frigidisoli]
MKIVKILGGLGNQMFQYAFYLSMSNKFKNVKVDVNSFENYGLHNGFELEKIFDLKVNKASMLLVKIFDPSYNKWKYRKLRRIFGAKNAMLDEQNEFVFDQEILNNSKNFMYRGYWQNENYFIGISDKIKTAFTFKKPLKDENLSISEVIKNTNSVSLHVRRGDYVGHSLLGGICDLDYYKKAVNLVEETTANPTFFVFSNDIEWCKSHLKINNAHYISWNKNEESYIDMQLMSICKHNIIANSSFSWWGAWLNKNPNKIVIAPKSWTNDSNYDDREVCPKNWIKI